MSQRPLSDQAMSWPGIAIGLRAFRASPSTEHNTPENRACRDEFMRMRGRFEWHRPIDLWADRSRLHQRNPSSDIAERGVSGSDDAEPALDHESRVDRDLSH